MKFYSCLVNLNGEMKNQVPMVGIPAAEVVMLQYLHGEDAVVNLREAKAKETIDVPAIVREEEGLNKRHGWNNKATRAYLRYKYGTFQDGRDKVSVVFGPATTPVPDKLDVSAMLIDPSDAERDKVRAEIEAEVRAEMEQKARESIEAEVRADAARRAGSETAAAAEAAKSSKKAPVSKDQALEALA